MVRCLNESNLFAARKTELLQEIPPESFRHLWLRGVEEAALLPAEPLGLGLWRSSRLAR